MDVAKLGVEVAPVGIDQTTRKLDGLTNASKRAEMAAEGLSSSTKNAGAAAAAAATGYDKQANAAQKAAVATKMNLAAINDNTRRMGGSMSGLAAQFQDIGVTAAMGMNPMIIALQQGTQISGQLEMAMQGGASATAVFGQALRSLFSPVSLIVIALTALVAAGLQVVDWPQLAAGALRQMASVLQTIAPYAATAAAGLALLYAPAIIGGIISVIALLGRLVVAAISAAAAMAAANPLGALVLGAAAAVAAMNIFRDEITQIFGRDIVADVKNAANFVINSFEAAFVDLKFIWNTFPDVIKAAVVGAANAALSAVEVLIQKAANLMNAFHSQVNKILPEGYKIPMFDRVSLDGYKMDDGGAADRVAKGLEGRNTNIDRIMGQDRVGQFGEAITRGASAASSKLKELATWITTVDGKTKKKGGATEAEKYTDIVDGANRRIAALHAEQAALGMTEEAALQLRYETDLFNQAQQKGIVLSAAQRAELSGLAGQMAATETATQRAREAIEFVKNTTAGFVNDLRNGLKNGEGFWKSFGNAALNVLDRITDKLLGDVMDAVFQMNGAGGGNPLGWLGSLFGLGAKADPWAGVRTVGYARGTASARAGVAMVGERGPELVRFKGGEKIVPNHQLRAANSNSSSAGPQQINITMRAVVTGTGDKELEARLQKATEIQMQEGLRQFSNEVLPGRVNEISRDPRAVG
jgi:hypothetical protein